MVQQETANTIVYSIRLYLLLCILSFGYLLIGINGTGSSIYDEGIVNYGAVRTLNGEIPHRDFWTQYGPGQFYALAGLFKIFGASVLVSRIWDSLIGALLSLSIYIVAKNLTSRKMALLPWGLTTIWLAYARFYNYPIVPALLFSMLSLLALFPFFAQKQKLLWLMASGILVGIEVLFRHDLGFYTILGEIPIIIIFSIVLIKGKEKNANVNEKPKILTLIGTYFLGIFIILVPVSLYFMLNVPLNILIDNLFIFPATIFAKFRFIPYPSFLEPLHFLVNKEPLFLVITHISYRIPFYFPFVVYLLVIVLILFFIRKKLSFNRGALPCILILVLFGLISFNQVRVRSDLNHLSPFLISSFVLVAVLLYYLRSSDKRIYFGTLSGISLIIIVMLISPVLGMKQKIQYQCTRFLPSNITHAIERSRFVFMNPPRADCVNYIVTHVPEGNFIYVGSPKHDQVFANDVMFYFLAKRDSATKYHELHPGHASTFLIQKEIVKDLIEKNVKYIILFSWFQENFSEPNESQTSSGVDLLDNFIRNNYLPVKRFGRYYTVWKKSA